jgi:cytosine/adenosine deaminase-related metal-dependent hydrolase
MNDLHHGSLFLVLDRLAGTGPDLDISIHADQTTVLAYCAQHNQGKSAVRHLTHINPLSFLHLILICIQYV